LLGIRSGSIGILPAVLAFGAPKNTPAEIIDKLNKEISVGLIDPKINARIAELGGSRPPVCQSWWSAIVSPAASRCSASWR